VKTLPEVDAYLVTYAINDRTSYHHAMDILFSLRQQPLGDAVVIMVANKTDLVRLREVAEQGGAIECKQIK
jgi:GTPase SAR1 family protein